MINHDFKPSRLSLDGKRKSRFRKRHALSLALLSGAVLLYSLSGGQETAEATMARQSLDLTKSQVAVQQITPSPSPQSASLTQRVDVDINWAVPENGPDGQAEIPASVVVQHPDEEIPATSPLLTSEEETLTSDENWAEETIRKGDNLSLIFKRLGLSARELYNMMQAGGEVEKLKNIRPGKALQYLKADDGSLAALRYPLNVSDTLEVRKTPEGYSAQVESKVIDTRLSFATGQIDSSLFAAGKSAGLSDKLVHELANIFGWDIDFVLDIRKGDRFSVLFEEKFIEGEFIGTGKIVAAEFINQGQNFQAVYYEDQQGHGSYYAPDGNSMRKAFLRAPLNFSYISSSFNPKRFHPILKRVKAHNGIDYRAPTGTPVKSAGDGRVIASAYNRYNGNYVFIQHGQGIITKYLHLSKKSVKKGQRVRQGQVIGLVGSTGMSQAPHLHYEFVVNGVHRNPRTVTLPKAQPIASQEKQRFTDTTKPLIAQLNVQQRIALARQDNSDGYATSISESE